MAFNLKHGALALGLAALMSACSGGVKPNLDSEWLAYSDEDGEAYGFFNPGTGQRMYIDEFESAPTSIIDGVFIVTEDGNVAVYGAADEKSPKIIGDLDELKEAGGVAEGMLPVTRPNQRIEVYSVSASKAELAFTLDPIDGKEITRCAGRFSEGLLVISDEDGNAGAVDKHGNVVIPLEYSDLARAKDGMMIATKTDDDQTKWYVINTKGEELFKFKKGISPAQDLVCDNGYFICKNDDNERIVMVDIKKDEYINMPKDVETLYSFNGDYAEFRHDGKWGVVKFAGGEAEVVVRAKYEGLDLLPWDPTKFVASKDGDEYFVMDFDGNKSIDFGDDYTAIVPVATTNWKGFVAFDNSGDAREATFLDTKGEKIKYDGAHEFYNLHADAYSSYVVSSDYFNLSEFVRQVSAAISTSGLCGYKMGAYANQYFPDDMNPRNFTYTYWFTPKAEPDIEGYRYSSSIRLSGYRSLAQSDWSYYSSTTYYFVPDNPLDGMDLTISGPYDIWEKAGEQIKDAITSKGFTIKSDNDKNIQYYTPNGDATLTLTWSGWGSIGLKYYKVY